MKQRKICCFHSQHTSFIYKSEIDHKFAINQIITTMIGTTKLKVNSYQRVNLYSKQTKRIKIYIYESKLDVWNEFGILDCVQIKNSKWFRIHELMIRTLIYTPVHFIAISWRAHVNNNGMKVVFVSVPLELHPIFRLPDIQYFITKIEWCR